MGGILPAFEAWNAIYMRMPHPRRRRLPAILLVLGLLATVAVRFAGTAQACGRERWPVKVGDDEDAAAVDLARAVPTTLAALTALAPPAERPEDARVGATERTVYVVEATLYAYTHESDGDYHLALRGPDGATLIAEIPDPACVGATSPFRRAIAQARAEFDARFKVYSRFRHANVKVEVTGVGFFDFDHHQRGVAPNAIELHPVLAIRFPRGS